jgi:uncharacterized protein (DUF1684 family)
MPGLSGRPRESGGGNDTEMTAAKQRHTAWAENRRKNLLVPQGGTELDRYLHVLIIFSLRPNLTIPTMIPTSSQIAEVSGWSLSIKMWS